MSDDWGDRYVVVVSEWHFGPFPFSEAHRFASENGGSAWPLWQPEDKYEFTQKTALEEARGG